MTELTGGARVGWVNATWPLAKLRASPESLEIAAAVVGTYRFRPEDVREIAPVTWIPLLSWGVRVHHVRADVPERVIFWTFAPPARAIEAIAASGFVARAPSGASLPTRAFPFRIPFLVGAIVLWNALVVSDMVRYQPGRPIPGPGGLVALALVFLTSLVLRRPGPVQRLALSSPDALPQIRGLLNLLTLVSGFMLVLGALMPR